MRLTNDENRYIQRLDASERQSGVPGLLSSPADNGRILTKVHSTKLCSTKLCSTNIDRTNIGRTKVRNTIVALFLVTTFTLSQQPNALAKQAEEWQPHQDIRNLARKHVLGSPEVELLSGVRAEAGKLDPRLRLRRCNMPLEAFHPVSNRANHKLSVGIACNGEKPWTIYLPVKVTAEYRIVSTIRSLARGSTLSSDDLRLKTIRMNPSEKPFINQLESAVGKELSRSLSAGTNLTQSMVRLPKVVSRGDNITMIVSIGSLEVRSSGKALQDGIVGQRIALQNVKSRRRVEGWVQMDGSVRVSR